MKACALAVLGALFCATISPAARAEGGDVVMRIVAPSQQETVHDNDGNVAVVVSVAPALQSEAAEKIVLLLDGKAVASGSGERFDLTGLSRGEHSLQAQLAAADGTVRAASAPISFYMWRASRLFRGRRR